MNLDQLKYLVSLHNTLSFSKTADDFFISRQAVTKSITSLENELNTVIVLRSAKGIEFTQEGLIVLNFALTTLNNYSEMAQKLNPKEIIQNKRITVYMIPRLIDFEFTNSLRKYERMNPGIVFSKKSVQANTFLNEKINESTIFFTTMIQDELVSEKFNNTLSKYNLDYTLLQSAPLGFCLLKNSALVNEVVSFVNAIKNGEIELNGTLPLPLIAFNYTQIYESINISKTWSDQYLIMDDLTEQLRLIKTGNYIATFTPFEFHQIFSNNHELNHELTYILYSPDNYFSYIGICNKQHCTEINDIFSFLRSTNA